MGTNYYAVKEPCTSCNREFPQLHIGKYSGGWCFALHVYSRADDHDMLTTALLTWDDWLYFFSKFEDLGYKIQDEYGRNFTP